MNTYEALKAELRRLKKRKRVSDVSAFLAEYIYDRLSLLDIVALIGGEPTSTLYGGEAANILEQPAARMIAAKALALMRVSEDWATFRHLYARLESMGRNKLV